MAGSDLGSDSERSQQLATSTSLQYTTPRVYSRSSSSMHLFHNQQTIFTRQNDFVGDYTKSEMLPVYPGMS